MVEKKEGGGDVTAERVKCKLVWSKVGSSINADGRGVNRAALSLRWKS